MALSCTCPASTYLTTIPSFTCSESFGQIQKVAFQRLTSSGTKNAFISPNTIDLKASWTAFFAAADSTKIVVSPYIEAPTQEAGAARTFGGGNETLGGMQRIIGSEPSSFTAVLRGVPQASVIIPMKELMCESDAGNLGVYLFDENGNVEAIQDPSVSTTFYPIPIRAFFVGDKVHGGLEAPDSNTISWQFAPNYSDHLKIVNPTDFNPLTDF
jgi:hypothetical protein